MKIHLKSGKNDQIRIHAVVPLTTVTMLSKKEKKSGEKKPAIGL